VRAPTVRDMDEQHWIDGYRARLAELRTQTAAASQDLADVTATAGSTDGAASVTVNAAGVLQQVVFGPAAEPLSRERLAEAVLEAARRAQAEGARQAGAAIIPLLGPRSAASQLLGERPRDAGVR
jgi:DNA-binding protein YbaB